MSGIPSQWQLTLKRLKIGIKMSRPAYDELQRGNRRRTAKTTNPVRSQVKGEWMSMTLMFSLSYLRHSRSLWPVLLIPLIYLVRRSFCRVTFWAFYGYISPSICLPFYPLSSWQIHSQHIKPNFHWVTHIFDQIIDYGPVYGFWT